MNNDLSNLRLLPSQSRNRPNGRLKRCLAGATDRSTLLKHSHRLETAEVRSRSGDLRPNDASPSSVHRFGSSFLARFGTP